MFKSPHLFFPLICSHLNILYDYTNMNVHVCQQFHVQRLTYSDLLQNKIKMRKNRSRLLHENRSVEVFFSLEKFLSNQRTIILYRFFFLCVSISTSLCFVSPCNIKSGICFIHQYSNVVPVSNNSNYTIMIHKPPCLQFPMYQFNMKITRLVKKN